MMVLGASNVITIPIVKTCSQHSFKKAIADNGSCSTNNQIMRINAFNHKERVLQ